MFDPNAKKFDAYRFLTHAMYHCAFGSDNIDREPDAGDIAAEKILKEKRKEIAQEKVR